MKTSGGVLGIITILATCAATYAVPIAVFNTGVDGAGHVLSDGTIGDPHYSLVSVPFGTTVTRVRTQAGGYPANVWVGDDTASAWIGPNNNGGILPPGAFGQVYGPVGFYDYRTTFVLPSAGTVAVVGQWAADDTGESVTLNGASGGFFLPAGDANWTSFSIRGTGLAGVNTLDFHVQNADQGFLEGSPMPGPTGLRVEITSANFVANSPEPGSVGIISCGLLALLLRRRQNRAAGSLL